MFQIQDTLVSLDVIEKEFCCDLQQCKGCCCIEGDAGAPLEPQEAKQIEQNLDMLLPMMSATARDVVTDKGIAYHDREGELVTQVVDGKDCVFSRTDAQGWCYCVIERAFKEGKIGFNKPISCHLYPIRLHRFPTFTAVEYHRWDICHCARKLGKHLHLPLYVFLKEPLCRRFGEDYYNELDLTAKEWKKQCSLTS